MKFLNTTNFPSGTHLQGYVTTTRGFIESVFGAPTIQGYEGYKVTTEWWIEFENGVVATIYDWKRYEQGAPESDEIYTWHIGGLDKSAVEAVSTTLGLPAGSKPLVRFF